MGDKIQIAALVLTSISAICAAAAAFANWIQARKAAQATEVTVYLALVDRYETSDMRDAISALAEFWREKNGAFGGVADAFIEELNHNPENARKLRGHSRHLSAFFANAARLYDGGFISKALVKSLISRPGLNVFYEVAVPINATRNPYATSTHHEKILKSVVARYGGGIY
jgi:hypothetical protein